MLNTDKLLEKYPELDNEVKNIRKAYTDLTDYFVSMVNKGEISMKDMLFHSVVNRTNQCIDTATYCLVNDLQFPLLNVIRQMIEIYAMNEYLLDDKKNFHKAFLGKKGDKEESLNQPNIYTIVQRLKKKEPAIIIIYDEYSEFSHPNSKSVFSVFIPGEQTHVSMNSYSSPIEKREAYHIMRNISGMANRILVSSKKINPLPKYITLKELKSINGKLNSKSDHKVK